MKKIVLIRLLALCLFAFTACNSTRLAKDLDKLLWVPFNWSTQEIEGFRYEKAAIFVPVAIDEIDDDLVMQFDLGANLTMLYGKAFAPYLQANQQLTARIDTINGYPYLTETSLILNASLSTDSLPLFYQADYGRELSSGNIGDGSEKIIGTLGANIIAGKVLIIDYPNEQFAILDRLPDEYQTASTFVDLQLDRWGRIHLPVTVNGEQETVLFDTGSSIFPLMTLTENWPKVTDGTRRDSVLTTTWGDTYFTYASNAKEVKIGERMLEDTRVFDAQNLSNFIRQEGVWGIMGNAHFLDEMIIIDTKNKKFGWMHQED